jgi:hypothetical protein
MASHLHLAYDRGEKDGEVFQAIRQFLIGLEGLNFKDRKASDFEPFVESLEHFLRPSGEFQRKNLDSLVSAMLQLEPVFRPHIQHHRKPGMIQTVNLVFTAGPYVITYSRYSGAKTYQLRICSADPATRGSHLKK